MQISPTQSNFLKLKKKLKIAREGYNLLDEKREVMIMELMKNVRGFKEMEEELTVKLKEAYSSLERASVSMEEEDIRSFGRGGDRPDIDVRMRSVMGIPVPELRASIPEKRVQASLDSTNQYFDEAFVKFREIIDLIVRWAAKEVLIWRLGAEISKTQKRVNALENIFIPEYEGNINRIEESLEEEEREEFFRRKKLKGGG